MLATEMIDLLCYRFNFLPQPGPSQLEDNLNKNYCFLQANIDKHYSIPFSIKYIRVNCKASTIFESAISKSAIHKTYIHILRDHFNVKR